MTSAVDHLRWIGDALVDAIAAAPAHVTVETKIFVTRAPVTAMAGLDYAESASATSTNASRINVSEKNADKKVRDVEELMSALNLQVGRPDVVELLRHEVDAAAGRVSVNGKHSFAMRARH